MNAKQWAGALVLALNMAWFGIAPAEAARAVVVDSTSVRSGPGSDFRTVGRLRAGDRINVTRCDSSRRWCHVESRHTRSGWVRSRDIDHIRGSAPGRPGGICFFGRRGEVCLSR